MSGKSDFPKGVAAPARQALASVGVTDLAGSARFSEEELARLHGMGPTALAAIKVGLAARGLSLR
jgi:hypothetical protein